MSRYCRRISCHEEAYQLTATQLFGWIETAGGILKVMLMVGISIALFVVAGEGLSPGPLFKELVLKQVQMTTEEAMDVSRPLIVSRYPQF